MTRRTGQTRHRSFTVLSWSQSLTGKRVIKCVKRHALHFGLRHQLCTTRARDAPDDTAAPRMASNEAVENPGIHLFVACYPG
ncbi:protein of unknown function [Candidatus Methylomirabilis oxygeniifera]|uniref:Uncharacterized protein n=1 Tax=Methylomirabilis oxygeniifera TaxID=671143 RepID=D5MJJ1_METO1|nr:protein of unknown function [Candidatus Methylomirabilis oxyfera]